MPSMDNKVVKITLKGNKLKLPRLSSSNSSSNY
jgi:hypothetical protein